MGTAVRDLWPATITATSDLVTPVALLKEQAALLGEKTQNLVVAEVSSRAGGTIFYHNFNLVAPALEGYRYNLFTLQHNIDLYPVTLMTFGSVLTIQSQEELIERLREALSDERTTKVIKSLIAQVSQ